MIIVAIPVVPVTAYSRTPAGLCPFRRRKHLTETAQRALNEWYAQHGKQPWQFEHPDGVTPSTIEGKPK